MTKEMRKLAMIDLSQIKNGRSVATQIDGLVNVNDVVTTITGSSVVASDDKVMSEAMVEQKLSTTASNMARHDADVVAITSAAAVVTEFSLGCVPTNDKVRMSINGVDYVEGKHFTVDRAQKTVTWTYTAANGGFDINAALANSVKLMYMTRQPATILVTSALPAQAGTLTYTGSEQLPTWTEYDAAQLAVEVTAQTEASEYIATVTPVGRYVWPEDGSNTGKSVTWSISKAAGTLELSKSSLTLTNDKKTDTFTVTRAGTGVVSAMPADTTVATAAVDGTTVTVTGKQSGSTSVSVSVAADNNYTAPVARAVSVGVQFGKVVGMILTTEGNRTGTWVRVDRDFNTVAFDSTHGTWAGMKTVNDATYGAFVEIPVTYVKTETVTSGPYAGKTCWWTADGPVDGFHVHPAFIGQDGQPHNLQVASYIASNKSGTPYSEDKGTAKDGYWNQISYDDVHAKGWMTGGARPYSIYDHHLLARLMLTEFGTPDVQAQTVNGVAWTGANRINYHGIYDPFGTPNNAEYYWLDGLATLNGTYQVLAANGSRNMIETGVSCPNAGVWPTNCRVGQVNGIDFGDLFIDSSSNKSENSGSFADYQRIFSGRAFYLLWNTGSYRGAFCLCDYNLTNMNTFTGWRVALCGSPVS